MWWAGMMTTSAGIATMSVGAVGDSSWTSIEDRRRVRVGAVVVALGSAVVFLAALHGAAGALLLMRVGILVLVAQLLAALMVTRFADEVGLHRRDAELTVRSRAKRHGVESDGGRRARVAPVVIPDEVDTEDDVSTGSFSMANLRAAAEARGAEPPPKRPAGYQPPTRR